MALPPGLVIAHNTSPYVTIYDQEGDTFTKLANPASLPPSAGYAVDISSDNAYLAIASAGSPYIVIYKRSGDTFTKLADPDVLPPGVARGVAFSADTAYLVVGHDTSPFITIYKRSGDTFTKLANPSTLPPGTAYAVTFSTDNTYLAVVSSTTPSITIYKRSGDTFTKLADPDVLPPSSGRGADFSSDNTYLAVSHHDSPFVTIYKRDGDTFTKLANPSALPPGVGYAVAFSPDTIYMSVAHAFSPYITIYKRSADTFTKLANPAALPPATANGVAFSPDNMHLAFAHNNSPFITIYGRSGDTFTKLANPATLPTGTGNGVAFMYAPITYLLSGTVTENGAPVSRTVRAYRRDTGALLGEVISAAHYRDNVLADTPVGYWRLGEASGTTAVDASGNARHGTYTGTYTQGVTALISSSSNTALSLTSGGIDLPEGAHFNVQAYTIEAWIKLSTLAHKNTIYSNYRSPDAAPYNGVALDVLTTGKLRLWHNNATHSGSGESFEGVTVLAIGTVYHVAVTRTAAGAVSLYVNGALDASGTLAEIADFTNALVQIGNISSADSNLEGVIDEVAFYNTALSGARIQAHYNAGVSTAGTFSIDTGGYTGECQVVALDDDAGTVYNALIQGRVVPVSG